MDYKLPSSRMERFMHTDNIALLKQWDTLKFVCASRTDLERAAEIIEEYKPLCPVFFSPVFGRIEPAEIVEFMKEKRLGDARLQLQMHKFIWDPEERGV
jgi:7-carboxy-7-deazaguanine synthase